MEDFTIGADESTSNHTYTWSDIPSWYQQPKVPLLIWPDGPEGDAITCYALRDGKPVVPMVPEQFLHVSTELYALDHRRAYIGKHVPAHTPQWERIRAALDLYTVERLYVPYPEDLLTTLATPGSVQPWWDQAVADEPAAQEQAAGNAPWPELKPLPSLLPPVKRLSEPLIPAPLRPWLLDMTARMQIPLEYVAIPALVALATVVGRRIGILPKRHDDWLVVPNLWGMIVGRPGVLKTPALQEALRPLARLAAEASKNYQDGKSRAMAAEEVHAAKVEALKVNMRKAAKANKDADLYQLSEQLVTLDRDVEPPLRERRYKTNDPTVEKLGELLQENPAGLLLFRDEMSGWLQSLDKAGREGDREFYLEAWNGTGSYDFDRIGRGTVHIPALCLSLLGGMTPGKMTTYVAETMQGGMGDDGLLQRFQLVVWPDVPSSWENIDRYPDTPAKNTAYTIYNALDGLTPSTLGLSTQETDIPALRFASAAQALFDEWRLQLETRLRADKEEPAFESHLSKYRSLMPSLALLFHLVDVAHDTILQRHEVSLKAAQLAAAWCDFLELHARRVYGAVLHGNVHSAHALLDHIKRGHVHDGDSPRKVSRHHWSLLSSSEMVAEALAVLEQHGWVRVETVKTDGRPTEVIRINPEVFSSK